MLGTMKADAFKKHCQSVQKQESKGQRVMKLHYTLVKPKETCCKTARQPNEVRNVTACVIRRYRTLEINWQY